MRDIDRDRLPRPGGSGRVRARGHVLSTREAGRALASPSSRALRRRARLRRRLDRAGAALHAACSHALVAGGRVWLIDPVDDDEVLERVRALGEPAASCSCSTGTDATAHASPASSAFRTSSVPDAAPAGAPFDGDPGDATDALARGGALVPRAPHARVRGRARHGAVLPRADASGSASRRSCGSPRRAAARVEPRRTCSSGTAPVCTTTPRLRSRGRDERTAPHAGVALGRAARATARCAAVAVGFARGRRVRPPRTAARASSPTSSV